MPRITQIQFRAERDIGAAIVRTVFASAPQPGEEVAWMGRGAMESYCSAYPTDRVDVGGYYRPCVPPMHEQESGVTTMIAPASGRDVSFAPEWGSLWTVNFGGRGSQTAAMLLLDCIIAADLRPCHVAWAPHCEPWMIYHNAPDGLYDAARDPMDGGAIGSNWQIAASKADAEAFVAEMQSRGWHRGHNHAPRF